MVGIKGMKIKNRNINSGFKKGNQLHKLRNNQYQKTKQYKDFMRIAKLGSKHSEETKKKMSLNNGNRNREKTKEELKLLSKSIKQSWDKNIQRKSITSHRFKKLWANKEWAEKTIKNQLKALFETRPTSLERKMIEIIKRNKLPYKYCGDGSFLIGFKNPDFVNVNGEKICIEVANTIHHKEDYPEKRIAYFKNFGWKCFVFRTNNLNEEEILGVLK